MPAMLFGGFPLPLRRLPGGINEMLLAGAPEAAIFIRGE